MESVSRKSCCRISISKEVDRVSAVRVQMELCGILDFVFSRSHRILHKCHGELTNRLHDTCKDGSKHSGLVMADRTARPHQQVQISNLIINSYNDPLSMI